jgi:hypothetical protein
MYSNAIQLQEKSWGFLQIVLHSYSRKEWKPSPMAKDTQINVRFPADTDQKLAATAAQLGVSKSSLVRRLTDLFLAEVEATGAVSLNPHWIKDLTTADGRSAWGEARTIEGSRPKKFSSEEPSGKSPKS